MTEPQLGRRYSAGLCQAFSKQILQLFVILRMHDLARVPTHKLIGPVPEQDAHGCTLVADLLVRIENDGDSKGALDESTAVALGSLG
jgi:hypothetical protein